jgi:hypothetical protein
MVSIGRQERIFQLEQEVGLIEGDENLKRYITNYYKRPLLVPLRRIISP